MVIGVLRIDPQGAIGEKGCNHIRDDRARFGKVEIGERWVHRDLLQVLASAQEFCIDRANLVEHLADPAKILDQVRDLKIRIVGYVVPSQSPTRLADAEIPLGPMSWSVHTMTIWPTAALVCLDQRAAQHLLDRWQVAHQLTAAFAQAGRG
jgi:hypothetical protein